MDLQLTGRTVLITGGSRGLGHGIALACADEGMRIAICARNRDQLQVAADEIRSRGGECITIVADLFKAEDCHRVVEETVAAYSVLDVLINNASTGVATMTPSFLDAADEAIMERFLGKTMAAVRCSRAAIPHMRRAGGGRVICIGGTAARTVFRAGESASTASTLPQGLGNASLANFTKYLADEVAADGILVNIVHPHSMHTPRRAARIARRATETGVTEAHLNTELAAQIPIGRLITPSDVVPIVLLLASPLASAITGQAIAVDGGALRNIVY